MLDETVGVVPQSLHRDRKGPIWLVSCGHVRKRWIRPLRCTGAPSLPDPTSPARLIAMQHSNAMRRRPDKLADIPCTPMRGVKEARTCLSGGRRLLPLWQARDACCPANDVHNSNCHDWNWRSSESRVGEEFCSSRRPHCMRLTASQRPSRGKPFHAWNWRGLRDTDLGMTHAYPPAGPGVSVVSWCRRAQSLDPSPSSRPSPTTFRAPARTIRDDDGSRRRRHVSLRPSPLSRASATLLARRPRLPSRLRGRWLQAGTSHGRSDTPGARLACGSLSAVADVARSCAAASPGSSNSI
jgi:hypothetical protein